MPKLDTSPATREIEIPTGSPPPVYDKPRVVEVAPAAPAPATNIVTLPAPVRDVRVTTDSVALFDTAKFEQMQRVASVMTKWPLIPHSFKFEKAGVDERGEWTYRRLSDEAVFANCFMAVNQAQRWRMDPFGVIQCASVINNRIMWEGKIVHAALQNCLGINLHYDFNDLPGMQLGVTVSGTLPGEARARTIYGDVANWHKGAHSPWAAAGDWKRQLRYMGAREWARAFAPGVMLGVIAIEEADEDIHNGPRPSLRRGASDLATDVSDAPEAPEIPDVPDVIDELPPDDVPVVKIEPAAAPATPAPQSTLVVPEPHKLIAELREAIDACRSDEDRAQVADQFESAVDALPSGWKTAARKLLKECE